MNMIRALVVVALLAVDSLAFAQCCPGDGACPAKQATTQAPTLAVVTTADILERAIASTDAAGQAVGASLAGLAKSGEKVANAEGLDEEKLAALQAKYFKTTGLLRYANNVVNHARFESDFISDDNEYLEATRHVLKAQKALALAQTLVDELDKELNELAAKVADVPVPVEDETAPANDG